jgi:hypothetical protein
VLGCGVSGHAFPIRAGVTRGQDMGDLALRIHWLQDWIDSRVIPLDYYDPLRELHLAMRDRLQVELSRAEDDVFGRM